MRVIILLLSAVLFVLVVMFGGLALIAAFDLMALAFTWIGVDRPEAGWMLLGVSGGGLLGLTWGLRRAGRPLGRAPVTAVAVLVVAALAAAGVRRQQGFTRGGDVAAAVDARARVTVRVSAEALNIRAEPSSSAPVMARVLQGMRLYVVGTSPDSAWYQVRTHPGGGAAGWVSARFVTRADVGRSDRPRTDVTRESRPADGTAPDSMAPIIAAPIVVPPVALPVPDSVRPVSGEPDAESLASVRRLMVGATASVAEGRFDIAVETLERATRQLAAILAAHPTSPSAMQLQRDLEQQREQTGLACDAEVRIRVARGELPPRCR